GAELDPLTATQLIRDSNGYDSGRSFVGRSLELARLLGVPEVGLVADTAEVSNAWGEATILLEDLGEKRFLAVAGSIDLVAGLKADWSEIRSHANPEFPGINALATNSPAPVVAEQVVHEYMHVVLAAYLISQEATE